LRNWRATIPLSHGWTLSGTIWHMPTGPGTDPPFWPAGNFGGRAYPTLMEPLGSINWISRGTRQMDGWMAGRNVREIDGSLT
jgi:hypothetical protein